MALAACQALRGLLISAGTRAGVIAAGAKDTIAEALRMHSGNADVVKWHGLVSEMLESDSE